MADNEQQPADDLRSLLAGAFDESAASASADVGEKPAPKAEAAPEKPAAEVEPEPKATDDRPRGPDGKFLKKEDQDADDAAKAKAKEEPAEKKASEPKAEGVEEPKSDPKTDAKGPPANWSASDKAMFNLQSPDAQAFLLKKVKELESGFTKKTEAIAELRKEYEPIQQLFAPHLDVLKQKNLTPQTVIRRWADVETSLANGKGVDIIDGIVKAYNIDKATLARKLGFTSSPSGQASIEPSAAQTPDNAAGAADPSAQMLAALEEKIAKAFEPKLAKIDQFEAMQRQAATSAAQARETAVETEINNFKSATNEKGELLHPYFQEVEQAMIALAQAYVASKQPIPKIDELYERAVWADPSTRTAMLATQKAAEQARQAEEARSKSRQAQRAASSVTGAPGTGQATRQIRGELSLREQLEEAAADAAG